MRATHVPARWTFCFVVLPAAWLTFGIATGANVVIMIPAAVVAASLAAATAYRSGRGHREAFGYFGGTVAMMCFAIFLFIVSIFTYYCRGGDTSGAC